MRALLFLILRTAFWGLSLWLLATLPAQATSKRNVDNAIIKLKKHIHSQIQKNRIPGCAVAVVYRNKVVFMSGFGVKRVGQSAKINSTTLFQLGSLSKPIASSLITVLESNGLLKIDDPVNQHLTTFSLKGIRNKKSLRIKHVLSHSTGVPRAGFNNLIESKTPYAKIRNTLQRTPVRTGVGKRYDYNNAMYGLISDITTSVTNTSFPIALHKQFLAPLGMQDTSATLEELLKSSNKATPHVRNRRGALIPCSTYSQGYYAVAPAGGINSTIKDMGIFLKAQLGGYPKVLSSRALSKLQSPQITTNTVLRSHRAPKLIKNPRYALGWRVVDLDHNKLVFHGGWLKGFTNFIGFMPEHDVGIVILHNGESKFASNTAVQFFENYLGITTTKAKSRLRTKQRAVPAPTPPPQKTTPRRQVKRTIVQRKVDKKPKVQRIKIKRIVTPKD